MGKISSMIELQDGMSQPLINIANSMQATLDVANDLNNVSIDMNISNAENHISELASQLQSLESVQNDIYNTASNLYVVPKDAKKHIGETTAEIQRLKAAMEYANPLDDTYEAQITSIEASMEKLQSKQQSLIAELNNNTVKIPVTWETNDFDVFSSTGVERYEQEVQSLNAYMNRLTEMQQRISQQAQNTDLFPENMVSDLNQLQGKIEAIRAKVQQIEDNPLNMGTDDASNQLEQLRSQLHQMIQEQNDLNAAVENLDVSAANDAYERLSSRIRQTESYIRDNTTEQGEFTNAIRQSETQASGLMKTIKRVVAAYATMQSAKMVLNISDTLTQTTARLNMMNDGLQTTEQLQKMIYAASERSRGSYQATADAVSKMGIMARDAFNSNAELIAFSEQLNKQFTIAGTSAEGVSAAMLQLTQAMGSGVLRGEELNSVFEQAPTIIQTIADYLNVPIGQIRAMAQEGQLSATVVKNAMLSAAEETNAKFESMPKTFGQIWTSIQNQIFMGFQPILQRLNEIANSKAFEAFIDGILSNILSLADMLTKVLDLIVKIGSFFADNWSIIEPIIAGIAFAMIAYNAALLVNNAIKTVSAIVSASHATAVTAEMAATVGMTQAQLSFNAALYACPITWIILAIIAVIALIYVVIAVINKVCDTQISATGVIMGTLATIGAYLFNQIAFWWNIISAFIEFWVNVWKNPEYAFKALIVNMTNAFLNFCMAIVQGNGAAIGVIVGALYAFWQIKRNIDAMIFNSAAMCIEAIVNGVRQGVYKMLNALYNVADAAFDVAEGAANGFDAAASAIANAFIGAANTAISAINSIISAINKIPGMNIGTIGTLSTVSYSGASNAVSAVRSHFSRPSAPETFTLDRMDFGSIGDAYNIGNQVGQDFAAGFESTVADIQAGMQDWLGEKPEDYWEAPKLDYINLGDAAKAGYNFGAGVEDKLSDLGLSDISDLQNTLNNIEGNTGDGAGSGGDTADNTGKMADALDCTDEELKYLRDIAERDVINKFTTADLNVNFGGITNNVSSETDLDGIVDYLSEKVSESLEACADGVYT